MSYGWMGGENRKRKRNEKMEERKWGRSVCACSELWSVRVWGEEKWRKDWKKKKKKRGAGVGGLRTGGGERMGKWVEWYIEI